MGSARFESRFMCGELCAPLESPTDFDRNLDAKTALSLFPNFVSERDLQSSGLNHADADLIAFYTAPVAFSPTLRISSSGHDGLCDSFFRARVVTFHPRSCFRHLF